MNPGPFPGQFWKKDEEVENLQKIIEDQEDEILDIKDLVDKQKEDIDGLKEKLEELLTKANEIRFKLVLVLHFIRIKCVFFEVTTQSKIQKLFSVLRRKLKQKRNRHKECLKSWRIMTQDLTKS